jgi:cold shock protein
MVQQAAAQIWPKAAPHQKSLRSGAPENPGMALNSFDVGGGSTSRANCRSWAFLRARCGRDQLLLAASFRFPAARSDRPTITWPLARLTTASLPSISVTIALGRHNKMPQGIVKFFKQDRGFGFIKPDDGGSDVFVHVSELEKAGLSSLTECQRVTFDVGSDKKTGKPRAANLLIAESAARAIIAKGVGVRKRAFRGAGGLGQNSPQTLWLNSQKKLRRQHTVGEVWKLDDALKHFRGEALDNESEVMAA